MKEEERKIKVGSIIHRYCPRCGKKIRLWINYIELVLGITLITLVLILNAKGAYERITVNIEGNTITSAETKEWGKLFTNISANKVIEEGRINRNELEEEIKEEICKK